MRRTPIRAGLAASVAGVPLALWPWGFNPFGPAKVAVLAFSAFAIALGVALDPAARSRLHGLTRFTPVRALAAVGVIAVLAAVVSADVQTAFQGSYPGYEAGLIALAAAACAVVGVAALGEDGVAVLTRAVTVALLLVSVLAVLERAGWPVVAVREYLDASRVRSTLGNAANLGLWAVGALPWAAYVAARDPDRRWRWLAVAAAACGAVALVLSGSRGALVALVLGAAVWYVLSAQAPDPARAYRRVAVGVCVAGAIALAVVTGIRATPGAVDTVAGRAQVWSATAPLVAQRPFLGWGPGGFGRAFVANMPEGLVDPAAVERSLEDPHNLLLSAAASIGPLGALLLAATVVVTAREAWRVRLRDATGAGVAAAASLAVAVAGLQFHFVTLEIATLVFASLGALAVASVSLGGGRPAAAESARTGPSRWAAGPWWAGAVLAGAVFAAAVGLVAADMNVATGFGIVSAGGSWEDAARAFGTARTLAPWESTVHWAQGRAAREAAGGGSEQALADGAAALERALALRPGDSRIVRDSADLLAAAGLASASERSRELLAASVERYEAVLELAPSDPLAWSGLGGSQLALGRVEDARGSLERAVELSPRYRVAWLNLALVRRADGDEAGALDAERTALELDGER